MTTLTPKEKTFQADFLRGLDAHGYIDRSCGKRSKQTNFDPASSLDREIFLSYLRDAQKDEYEAINDQYKDMTSSAIDDFIISEYVRAVDNQGLDHVIVHGFDVGESSFHLRVSCPRPSSSANKELWERYVKNVYSYISECKIDDAGRDIVDIAIFRNGILYALDELKYTKSGQNVSHAIRQWERDRADAGRVIVPNRGCLALFAQDEDEVFFSTDIAHAGFLPFNKGSHLSGDRREIDAGNDLALGKTYKTSYMWEEILSPETFDYIFDKMVLSEIRNVPTFPRYHQYDTVRKIDEMTEHLRHGDAVSGSYDYDGITFLTQQAPGAGKTLEIAWTSTMLASRMNDDNQNVYDKVIILTDRVTAVRNIADELVSSGALPQGYVVYAEKDSQSLLVAVKSNCRIIITSAQKFLHKCSDIAQYNATRQVRYAVLIDEAHGNTEGKNQGDVTDSLLGIQRAYDKINADAYLAKENHIDWFAYTATPKPSTMRMFGRDIGNGAYAPHTVYSMKQAIAEGFILDVLQNVYTINTTHVAEKRIQDDPIYESSQAKRELQREAEKSWEFIRYTRIPAIVDDFINNVDGKLLNGREKALVVCPNIEAATRYKLAYDEFVAENDIDLPAMVAFSGTATIEGESYTEHALNPGVRGDIGEAFKRLEGKEVPRIMFVANKYQQAYNLVELCAGYICRHIGSDIWLVQMYGRLNRVAPGEEKKTRIVDFENSWDEICTAFAPFYSTYGRQPKNVKSVSESYAEIMDSGIVQKFGLDMFASYMTAASNGAPEEVLRGMQPMFDRSIDDAYERFLMLDDDAQKKSKKSLKQFVEVFAMQRIIAPDIVNADEATMSEFVQKLLKKMRGRATRNDFILPDGDVEFIEHNQVVVDAITDGRHIDDSDASLETWIDAHVDELSVDSLDERYFNARREEKEQRAAEERSEFLSRIINEYNASNKDRTVNKTTISEIFDKVVGMLGQDEKLRQAALSDDIDDYRKQYMARARELSHSVPLELNQVNMANIEEVVFFMQLWQDRTEDIKTLMNFHCASIFYKLRREYQK